MIKTRGARVAYPEMQRLRPQEQHRAASGHTAQMIKEKALEGQDDCHNTMLQVKSTPCQPRRW